MSQQRKRKGIQSLRDEDRERLEKAILKLTSKVEHDKIRELYQFYRQIRKELDMNTLPIAQIYRASLAEKFNDEYGRLSTERIAEIEKMPRRTMYRLRKEYYTQRSLLHNAQKQAKHRKS